MRSAGIRYLVVGLLTLLMTIPLFLAGAVIQDRKGYADQTRRDIGVEWGGRQVLSGPILLIPVEGDVTRQERRKPVGVWTETEQEIITIKERGRVAQIVLLPEQMEVELTTETQLRNRGIFEVPVYSADVAIDASFDAGRIAGVLTEGEIPLWHQAELRLGLGANSGLRGEAVIQGPDGPMSLEPYSSNSGSGIAARPVFADARPADNEPIGPGLLQSSEGAGTDLAPQQGTFSVQARFTLNGAHTLMVAPVGRTSLVHMTGDWADPSFTGAFLPDRREIGETGYSASWTIPHLARTLPQVSRGPEPHQGAFAFGTEFVQLNDFYQKAFRAARYGILFIALTFLTVLLIDRKERPTHPVQYILIGLAQAIFVLLMVAYAEQVGFTLAYAGAAAATIGLLVLFGFTALKLGARTLVLGAMLVVLYAVLYLILRSTDLALLAGATLAFGALALTMVLTRNENWYGPRGPGKGLPRTKRHVPATPMPPDATRS